MALFQFRAFLVWLLVSLLVAGCASPQSSMPASKNQPGISTEQGPASAQQVTALVAGALDRYHVSPPASDAELSRRIAESALHLLDPSRQLFLQSEVDALRSNVSQWPSRFRNGDTAGAYSLHYNVELRIDEEKDFQLGLLTSNTRLTAPAQAPAVASGWAVDRRELASRWRARLAWNMARTRPFFYSETQLKAAWIASYSKQIEYSQVLTLKQAEARAINTLAQGYDGTTHYQPIISDHEALQSFSLVGVGLVLHRQGDEVEVSSTTSGGPAEEAGLRPGERIVALGHAADELVPVLGWSLYEIVSFMRGPAGTDIYLAIASNQHGEAATRVEHLVRRAIRMDDQRVTGHIDRQVVAGQLRSVGVIVVPAVYASAPVVQARRQNDAVSEVEQALMEFEDRGVTAVVLDVRGAGGNVLGAEGLASLFLPEGQKVGQIATYDGSISTPESQARKYRYNGPLVLLQDALTGGAAEMFTASLRDQGRAVLLGQRTNGAGGLQIPLDFNERGVSGAGTLQFPSARAYRITGQGIQLSGVTPDLILPEQAGVVRFEDRINPLPAHDLALTTPLPNPDFEETLVSLKAWHQRQLGTPRWQSRFAETGTATQAAKDVWLEYAAAAAAEYARIAQAKQQGGAGAGLMVRHIDWPDSTVRL